MARMNEWMLKSIYNLENNLEYQKTPGVAFNPSIMVQINGKLVRKDDKVKYSNLLKLQNILEKAINGGNVLKYGDIGICAEDYSEFMKLMFYGDTGLKIPSCLFVFGLIPGTQIFTPPIPPDNRPVEEIEEVYMDYYSKNGIYPKYENGIRQPYPHELYKWNADGPIESSFNGKPHNLYYEKVYLPHRTKELAARANMSATNNNNNVVSNNSNNNNNNNSVNASNNKKRFGIFSRRQATEEEKARMAASAAEQVELDVNENNKKIDLKLNEEQKKDLRKTLIMSGIAIGLFFVTFNAAIVIPAFVGHPAMIGALFTSGPGTLLKSLSVLATNFGIPIAIFSAVIPVLIKDFKARRELKRQEKAEALIKENEARIKKAMEQLKEQLVGYEKAIADKDAKIEEVKKYTPSGNAVEDAATIRRITNTIQQIEADKEKLEELKNQILNQMASYTAVPTETGGMTR